MRGIDKMCYKITSLKTVPQPGNNQYISVNFAPSMSEKALPQLNFYFTSEPNSYGAVDYSWMEGDVYHIKLKKNEFKQVSLVENNHSFLSQKAKCTDQTFYECLSEKYHGSAMDCPINCLPHSLPKIKNSKLGFCSDIEEYNCSIEFISNLWQEVVKSHECSRSCQIKFYNGRIDHEFITG